MDQFNILAILAFIGKAAVGGAGGALAALGAVNAFLITTSHAAAIGSTGTALEEAALCGAALGVAGAYLRLRRLAAETRPG